MVTTGISEFKFRQVYDVLRGELSSGRFRVGSKLPSERFFATRLQVTTGTVRRAFRDLIIGGIVEKRLGSGTYLCAPLDSCWEDRAVNLVFDESYIGSVKQELAALTESAAAQMGRKCRLVNVTAPEAAEFFEKCIIYQQPSILCMTSIADVPVLQKNPGLFVALSSLVYEAGIPVVKCDDDKVITLLMSHLQKAGHHRIALVMPNAASGNGLNEMQTAVWRSALGSDYDPSLLLTLSPAAGDFIAGAFQVVTAALRDGRFTALICSQDEVLYGAMNALRAAGKQIPQEIAIASIGNSSLSQYAWPPVTSIDPNLKDHVRLALELLVHNHQHPDQLEKLRLVSPLLISRASTASNQP